MFLFISGFSLALNKTHPNYELDKTQFFINRVLRIFPVWIVCILILTLTNNLTGINVFTLLLLQAQDIPTSTAFGLAWSIQLEFMCYLLFPVLLSAVASRKNILPFFAFFLLVRLWMFFVPTRMMWQLSYSTVFGGGTIFLTGIFTSSLPPLKDKRIAKLYLASGVAAFCLIAVFIHRMGGYQTGPGAAHSQLFSFHAGNPGGDGFPDCARDNYSCFRCGGRDRRRRDTVAAAHDAILSRCLVQCIWRISAACHIRRICFRYLRWILPDKIFGFIKPSGWLSLIASSALYFMVLTLFSTVSFYAIELPFLRMRRRYVHRRAEPPASKSSSGLVRA